MISKRLDIWLSEKYPDFSRSYFESLIREKGVFVNGCRVKKGYNVKDGDEVKVHLREKLQDTPPQPENIPLAIVYEDADILLIDKPIGLVVHPGAGNWSGTFANALMYHCSALSAGDPHRPGIVHRLDKQTSGLLLSAKTEFSHRHLSRQFATREVKKNYLALTCQKPKGLRADFAIARDRHHRKRMAVSSSGRPAQTDLRIVGQVKNYHLIEATPLTGRTHQIRLHLSALKAPIAGDFLYGGNAPQKIDLDHPLLHAWKLSFTHPISEKSMHFCAPLPLKFSSILRWLGFDELPFELAT